VEITALDIEGDVHARLYALENYYAKLAKVGVTKSIEKYHDQINALTSIIKRIQDVRFHFNHLRQRHSNLIERALGGDDGVVLTLNYQEALLVDTIRDMHASIWNIRRDRIARHTGRTVDQHAESFR
jgi:hypothetical protein